MKTTDTQISHNLVGKWLASAGAKWSFAEGGQWSYNNAGSSFAGTWQVVNTELSMTVTNYSGPPRSVSPIGHVLYCTIVRVDDKELVEDLGESIVTLHRQA